jgi:terminal uridylyltransferase
MMFKQMGLFDVQAELLAAQETGGEAPPATSNASAGGSAEVWQSIRTAQKMHMTTYDCLIALRSNKIAMGMLTAEQRSGVHSVIGLYCPLLSRFFKSFSDLQKACIKEIGFEPAPLDPSFRSLCFQPDRELNLRSRAVLQDLTRAIATVARQLIPPPSFATEREEIRHRLQQLMRASGVVPITCSLVLFGSSKNNFGAAGADLDMCLQYQHGEVLPVGEERSRVIEALGEVMAREGMVDVQARSTARIPIVLFKDCVTGIDCDISFNNPLAICNTELLATYSLIDDRVRALAFAIKHWAKRREINSPQNGTLSSYGYLLCLIHFLQTKDLVPDLQSLSPSWDPMSGQAPPPPVRLEPHPVEGVPCNTYFYDATKNQNGVQKLKKFSAQNKQSLGELLMEFFRYFAYDFDYRRDIVSIRHLHGDGAATKLSKMESSCWGSHERLSVEDPFETWYDVAHVLKSTQMTYIRAEFLRAYTLLYNAAVGSAGPASTEGSERLFEQLCAPPAEAPKFVVKQQQAAAEKRSRSNTMKSES